MKRKSNTIIICGVLAVIITSIFPALFLYTINAEEANLTEALLPVLIFAGSGLTAFVIWSLFTKSFSKGSIITILFMIIISNYALIEKGIRNALPMLKYWHILPILIFMILHLAYFIYKKMPEEFASIITKIIAIMFSCLICFNLIMAAPTIINKISMQNEVKNDNEELYHQGTNEALPNIYYMIFDEYASFNQIKEYYDYDNSEFAAFLEDSGFTVSYDSHNESIVTTTVTANLISLDYIAKNTMSEPEKDKIRKNGILFQMLKNKGYQIRGVGETDLYGLSDATGESSAVAKTIGGETFTDLLIKRSVVYPFFGSNSSEDAQKILNSVSFMSNHENFSGNGQFIMFHLLCPHCPFVFDENGGKIPYENYINWKDKQYYLGQYIYTTKLIRQMVDSIVKNDPGSIIIIQSDHGARASYDPELFMELFNLNDMNHIMNAVYYRGEPIEEIKGQSGVNTLRIILNRLFDLNMDLLEVPEDVYKYK